MLEQLPLFDLQAVLWTRVITSLRLSVAAVGSSEVDKVSLKVQPIKTKKGRPTTKHQNTGLENNITLTLIDRSDTLRVSDQEGLQNTAVKHAHVSL